MRTQTYWTLGVLVLLIIVFCVYFMVFNSSVDTADIVETPPEPEQSEAFFKLKAPPLGETFATGYWAGDTWLRTVPPEPETVMYEGEPTPLWDLLSMSGPDKYEDRLRRIIAEAPYSEAAFSARLHFVYYDENGNRFPYDNALTYDRLLPLLEYHPDSPRLLHDLLMTGRRLYPEAAIHYGTEALKYVDRYRMDSNYGKYPEWIHNFLGHAYQEVGDYSKALTHYQKTLALLQAYPGRMGNLGLDPERVENRINRILLGNPLIGPLSKKRRSGTLGVDSVASPAASQSDSLEQEQPRIRPGDPLYDDEADAEVFSEDPRSGGVDPRVLAKQQAEQFIQQAARRQREADQRFDTFVRDLHQMATIKTDGDFEAFLMEKMLKRLDGTRTDSEPNTGGAVSADRMRRASQIFRKSRTPAEGFKALQEADPDLAKTLQRIR